MSETRHETKQDEGWTKNDQQQEPRNSGRHMDRSRFCAFCAGMFAVSAGERFSDGRWWLAATYLLIGIACMYLSQTRGAGDV